MIKIIEPNFEFEDERGKLTQLVREGYKQVNVIYTRKGVVRGNHFHKLNQEAFFIIEGSCEVKLKKNNQMESHIFNKGDMFVIPEFVLHEFVYLQDTILVSMYSKGVELRDGEMDIYNE